MNIIIPSSSSSLYIWNLWLPGKPIYQVTRLDPWFRTYGCQPKNSGENPLQIIHLFIGFSIKCSPSILGGKKIPPIFWGGQHPYRERTEDGLEIRGSEPKRHSWPRQVDLAFVLWQWDRLMLGSAVGCWKNVWRWSFFFGGLLEWCKKNCRLNLDNIYVNIYVHIEMKYRTISQNW